MKKTLLSIALVWCVIAISAQSNTPWQYVDAQDLRIINKGWDDTYRKYSRLPAEMRDSVRPTLWERVECSSGIGIRFATDSKRIGSKYRLLWNTHMPHIADTGLKGTDIYVLEGDSVWRHLNTNRPNAGEDKICEPTYLNNMDGTMREYMIYLPLYDGVEEFWVKIDSGATITPGSLEYIRPDRKIVAYGTSIMQGGCASRTGMASTNMLSRELNCEVVNIGMSGEGKMDPCMARLLTRIPDVDVYLIDPVPNCTPEMVDTLTYEFVNIIRKACPDTKIVMVEGPIYPYAPYDSYWGPTLTKKNELYRKNYEKLKAENPDNIYYVTCENLDGAEDDGTVDGVHLTDLGFRHYVDKLLPVLRPLMPPLQK